MAEDKREDLEQRLNPKLSEQEKYDLARYIQTAIKSRNDGDFAGFIFYINTFISHIEEYISEER